MRREEKDLHDYLDCHLRYDDTAFGRAVASCQVEADYLALARYDLEILSRAAQLDFAALKRAMAAKLPPDWLAQVMAMPELRRGAALELEPILQSYARMVWACLPAEGHSTGRKGRSLWSAIQTPSITAI